MIVNKKERKGEKSKSAIIYDYPISDEVGVSVQELDGRSPERGFYKNKVTREVCYVLSGSAIVFINNKETKVEKEDLFVINPNEKHYITAKKLKLIVFTTPDWKKEQCEHID
jgi:mannose-6-phosphate isomerase-like protein (cupin superfamily)